MKEPRGDGIALLRDLPLRRGLLRVGGVLLAVAGLRLLREGSPEGAVFILAGAAGTALAHRRAYSVVIWVGVAVHGVWTWLGGGNPTGLLEVVAGLAGVFLGLLHDASLRLPEAVVSGIASLFIPPPRPAPALAGEVASAEHVVPLAQPSRPTVEAAPAPVHRPAEAELTINSIGRFQLLAGGRDVTQELLGKRVLSFDWLYLLARAVLSEDSITRLELGAAVAPGVSNQKDRVRDQLRDMQRKLPPAIGQRIAVNKELVRFDAAGCDWDVARLRMLKLRCEQAGELVPDDLLADLEREVASIPAGEFLPGWDHIEREVTEGRGSNDDLIRDARFTVDRLRADLTAVLAANLRARGLAGRAIGALESERARSPEHPGIFQNLRKAYLETGQHEHAAALTRRYEAGEL